MRRPGCVGQCFPHRDSVFVFSFIVDVSQVWSGRGNTPSACHTKHFISLMREKTGILPPPFIVPRLPAGCGFTGVDGACLRILDAHDYRAWTALRDTVIQALPDPDLYVRERDEPAFYAAHVEPMGETLGVFVRDQLVAYAMVEFPKADAPDNMARMIGWDPACYAGVAHLSSCMVLPKWRGLGLQRALLTTRIMLALSHGRYLCMAMVSLRNLSSIHNMLSRGLHIAWTGMLDGCERHVMVIDLQDRLDLDAHDEKLLSSVDFPELRAAARAGYVGIEMPTSHGNVPAQLRYVRVKGHGAHCGPL